MENKLKITVNDLDLYYGQFQALKNVTMNIEEHKITALIGPSGCGKSTFLKTLNRMNDLVKGARVEGKICLDGVDIYKDIDAIELRKRVGMVFQQPNPFPKSIYDNVAYGPRINGIKSRAKLDEIVERSLKQAAIWDELKDRLHKSALGLSGGQQQRLCIARTLAVEPEVLAKDVAELADFSTVGRCVAAEAALPGLAQGALHLGQQALLGREAMQRVVHLLPTHREIAELTEVTVAEDLLI